MVNLQRKERSNKVSFSSRENQNLTSASVTLTWSEVLLYRTITDRSILLQSERRTTSINTRIIVEIATKEVESSITTCRGLVIWRQRTLRRWNEEKRERNRRYQWRRYHHHHHRHLLRYSSPWMEHRGHRPYRWWKEAVFHSALYFNSSALELNRNTKNNSERKQEDCMSCEI